MLFLEYDNFVSIDHLLPPPITDISQYIDTDEHTSIETEFHNIISSTLIKFSVKLLHLKLYSYRYRVRCINAFLFIRIRSILQGYTVISKKKMLKTRPLSEINI